MFLSILLALPSVFAAPSTEDPPKPVVVETDRTKAALDELKSAFAKPEAGPRLRAIESARDIDDDEVVRAVARGLGDKDLTVQSAAIEALRFNPNGRAFDELLARAKVKSAKDDLTVYAALLRAVGQHGDPKSIDVLTENLWAAPDAQVIQAKILGLGKIRTKESLKELVDLMQVAGQNKIEPFMTHFRLALWSLSGADQGQSRELWLTWYRENKANLKIAPEPATEPAQLARRWESYWARPDAEKDAPKPREGKGGRRKDEPK